MPAAFRTYKKADVCNYNIAFGVSVYVEIRMLGNNDNLYDNDRESCY